MNKRGFLSTILATCAAPAIVRASSLMPIRVVDAPRILVPIHDLTTRITDDHVGRAYGDGHGGDQSLPAR